MSLDALLNLGMWDGKHAIHKTRKRIVFVCFHKQILPLPFFFCSSFFGSLPQMWKEKPSGSWTPIPNEFLEFLYPFGPQTCPESTKCSKVQQKLQSLSSPSGRCLALYFFEVLISEQVCWLQRYAILPGHRRDSRKKLPAFKSGVGSCKIKHFQHSRVVRAPVVN